MHELFIKSFNKKVPLTTAEEEIIWKHLTSKTLLKNQYLLQEGADCNFFAFVNSGALRQFSVDEAGNSHIFQFAMEGWTIGDVFSFLTGEPSTYNNDALENTGLTIIEKQAHEALLKLLPKYETYTRLQLTGAYISMQRRLNSSISYSPEKRYNDFIAHYPGIAHRVPQHMIASFLGLQPETLSRIRKKQYRRS